MYARRFGRWLIPLAVLPACGARSILDEEVSVQESDAGVGSHCPSHAETCNPGCDGDTPGACGPSCAACSSPPPHGSATCSQGQCGVDCDDGFMACDAGCCAVSLAAGRAHTCYLGPGGVRCWGDNTFGQLGDGTHTSSPVPVAVSGLPTNAIVVSAGLQHTCALVDGAGAWCWGENRTGALGDGTRVDRAVPAPVVGLEGPLDALEAGGEAACAVFGGTLRCWGTIVELKTHPAPVVGVDTVRGVSLGSWFGCVVTGTGGAKCWGNGTHGELGNGRAWTSTSATDVATLSSGSGVVSVAAGDHHACAVRDRGVSCWGTTKRGEQDLFPGYVSGLRSPVHEVSAGVEHACARVADGEVQCWGENSHGQLGNPEAQGGATPVDVIGLPEKATKIAAGRFHTCALFRDGRVACWGANASGQLGDGSRVNRPIPVVVERL